MRRVVVTGLGLVTPLGADVETDLGEHPRPQIGAGPITRFDASDQKCTIACEVKPADHEYGFDPGKRVDHKVQRQVDPFIIYGIDAAGQAIEDAGLTEMGEAERCAPACSIGSGIGGLPGIESESLVLAEKGPRRVSPHFVHGRLINLISGQVSDQIRPDGSEPRGRHRLLDRRAFDRRRGADDRDGRCRHHARGRRRRRRSARSASPASRRRARSTPASTTGPSRPAVPTTRTATASSWARARASSCSRNMSTPRRAARKSMPKWSAMACRATPITSPRRIPRDRARTGRWKWR